MYADDRGGERGGRVRHTGERAGRQEGQARERVGTGLVWRFGGSALCRLESGSLTNDVAHKGWLFVMVVGHDSFTI